MLSLNHIGNLGRLGNQMFQYASLKGIATNRGYDFCIPPRKIFGKQDSNVKESDVILYDVFDLENKNNINLLRNPLLSERFHHFDDELFTNCPDNVDLFGYFQTEKYFWHIETEIRKDFSFSKDLIMECEELIKSLGSEVISLHVRRGDYISNSNHPIQTIEYYKKALELLPETASVLVFSDDSEWCDKEEFFNQDRFLVSQNSSTHADLCMMSLCNYHVIANSSFSWWGAWLAKSEKIIAPKNWFGGECETKSVKDMSFGNWSWL